ncbi:hypothetical protein E6O75_ATG09054 [Venturia nashicola]|uniref:TNT domain-containing protein n=1 Tax=Venturia nashicola TaxID=86259 RepID=A0A4Z1NP41_9PEZI|nr:hypothetical protein E6O75_ATG09054 [Venturia nashicola]
MLLILNILVASILGRSSSASPVNLRDITTGPSRCPDFCAGTNATSDSNIYVCGDPRLGPWAIPTALPLTVIAGKVSNYHRFAGLCPGKFLAKYTAPETGLYVYPPFDGFQLSASGQPIKADMELEPGLLLDRFGSEYGLFLGAAGAPYSERSLPPSNLNAMPNDPYPFNYHRYEVAKPFLVIAGPIAGAFGQQGLGTQFVVPETILSLVNGGFLTRLNLPRKSDRY